jgi:hypothetical protein
MGGASGKWRRGEMQKRLWWENLREGDRSLSRPGRRCKDNIKINLLEVGWGSMDWIDLA